MNDQGTALSALVVRLAEIGLLLVILRITAATLLAGLARAMRHRHGGARIAAAAVVLAPRFARGALITAIGATVSVTVPAVGAHAGAAPRVPILDRVVTVATAPPSVPVVGPSPHRPPPMRTYLVRPGDSLWSIASGAIGEGVTDERVATAWPRWYAANRAVIGDDPARIHPGQLLRAPETRGNE